MRSDLVHTRIELLRGYSIEIASSDERSATVAIQTLLSGDLCSILAKGRQSRRLRVKERTRCRGRALRAERSKWRGSR